MYEETLVMFFTTIMVILVMSGVATITVFVHQYLSEQREKEETWKRIQRDSLVSTWRVKSSETSTKED